MGGGALFAGWGASSPGREKAAGAALRGEDAFLRAIVGAQLVHSKVGVVTAHVGAGLGRLLQIWDEQEEALLGA